MWMEVPLVLVVLTLGVLVVEWVEWKLSEDAKWVDGKEGVVEGAGCETERVTQVVDSRWNFAP